MKKPYYLQQEDCEPEFIGFYESYDDVISSAVDNGWSYEIGSMTIIDEITEDMLDQFEEEDEYETIKEYFEKD